jgi:hypothetical protein
MRLLVALLIVLAIPFALAGLIPVLSIGIAFAAVFGGFLIWLLPILIIATSDRTTGAEKLAWILAIIFLSWFAWIFYALLAPIKQPRYGRQRRYRRESRYYRDYSDYRYD